MIYCTVGTSSCGKSSYVEQLAKNYGMLVIDGDKIREMLFGRYFYDEVLEPAIKNFAINLARDLAFTGKDVIIDDASWFLSEEDRFGCFFGNKEYMWIYFKPPTVEDVIRHRKDDLRGYSIEKWIEVVEEHKKRLQKPKDPDDPYIYVDALYLK